jgi:hypothetical protein
MFRGYIKMNVSPHGWRLNEISHHLWQLGREIRL